jgi:hypothetical protein
MIYLSLRKQEAGNPMDCWTIYLGMSFVAMIAWMLLREDEEEFQRPEKDKGK